MVGLSVPMSRLCRPFQAAVMAASIFSMALRSASLFSRPSSPFGQTCCHWRSVLMTIVARGMSRLPAFDLVEPILAQLPARCRT
jgi:hypothetical protein